MHQLMRTALLVLIVLFCATPATCQESMEKVMESRVREMYRVLCSNDREEWKKFIRENYSQNLIDKPMQAKRETSGSGPAQSSTSSHDGNIDGKAEMYQLLHNDFAGGKITSIKTTGETLKMVVSAGDMTGTF